MNPRRHDPGWFPRCGAAARPEAGGADVFIDGGIDVRTRRAIGLPLALLTLFLMTGPGCSYALEGKVVRGAHGAVVLAQRDDPNLDQPGLGGVSIELTLDPGSIAPRSLGTQLTDPDGRFRFPIDAAGAGLLEYDVGILCRHQGYQSLYQTMPLPAKRRPMLIVLAPGNHSAAGPEDVIAETLRLGGQRDPR